MLTKSAGCKGSLSWLAEVTLDFESKGGGVPGGSDVVGDAVGGGEAGGVCATEHDNAVGDSAEDHLISK
nr:hypothetical protein CFP56_14711 [Quercus suber]